jgi:hypothetical protein
MRCQSILGHQLFGDFAGKRELYTSVGIDAGKLLLLEFGVF